METSSQTLVDTAQRDVPPSVAIRHASNAGLLIVASSSMADFGGELRPKLLAATANLIADVLCNHMTQEVDLLRRNPIEDQEKREERITEALRISVRRASREANALTGRRDVRVATTLDAILIDDTDAFVCHVGDGRVYLRRDGQLHRLTRDHLPVRSALDPRHRRLIRAVGLHVGVEPETVRLQLAARDRLVVLSPWLHRALDEPDLRQLAADASVDGAAARVIAAARSRERTLDLGVALLDIAPPLPEGLEQSGDQSRIRILARVPLFAYCSEAELRAIASLARPLSVPTGALVFQDGEPGQEIFLVLGGAVQIVKGSRELARLGPGSNFGEMSMLDETHRSAAARVLHDAELLVIDRDAFRKLLKGDPTLAVKVLWNMLLRLSANLRATSARLATLEGDEVEPE